jgi:hypothetical protein
VIDQLHPLGLSNDALSFLAAEEEKPAAAAKKGAKRAETKGPQQMATKPAAKTTAPGRAAAQTNLEEGEEAQHDVWFWNMVTPEGKKVTKKLTTEQVRALIKAGRIDREADLGKTLKGDYRGAATFNEFQGAFMALEVATKANTKGAKYKSQMKELQDAYDRKQKYGWIGRTFGNAGRRLFGLLWILLILGVAVAGGYFVFVYFVR